MAESGLYDARQLTAERNVEAILHATERLLRRGDQPSFTGIAAEAGLSRPTVYAHFDDRGQLLGALVESTVRQAMTAIAAAEPERGSAMDALRRVIRTSWEQLARHEEIARRAAMGADSSVLHRAHREARMVLGTLIRRGRQEGVFRSDLPVDWLVTCCLALIHAAAGPVLPDQGDPASMLDDLTTTVEDICVGRTMGPRRSSRTPEQTRGKSGS
jgi:AcrR family transcriptional regulator